MKTPIVVLCIIALFATGSLSCAKSKKVVITKPVSAKKLPPGQAKKLTGSKSAKPYAPGQQKKKH